MDYEKWKINLKNDIKIGKIIVKMPHKIKKPIARKQIFVQTPLSRPSSK